MSKILKSNNPGASDQVKRPTAPALITFLDAIDDENRNSPNGNWSRVSAETIMQLVGAAQNYYESAVRARTYLVGGLAGGAIIGAGIYGLIHLINGKGERPKHFDEPLQLPPPSTAVNAHDNDGAVAVPSLPHARKITDEEVELIHAWYESGVSKREIANRLCISVQTVNARIK